MSKRMGRQIKRNSRRGNRNPTLPVLTGNRRHRTPLWKLCCAVAALLSLILFSVDSVTASTSEAHAPRQRIYQPLNPYPDVHSNSIHLIDGEGDSIPPLTASMVRVIPPSPDDSLTELECGPNATLYETCGGAERYCAPLPHSHQDGGNRSNTTTEELPAWLFSQDTDYSMLCNGTDNHTTLPPIPDNSNNNNNNNNHQYYCLHKTLWYPAMDARDLLMLVLTTTCCFLAAMAGIGGGGLILPILLLVNHFTPKEASVLSNTAVFCNTLGQFCVNQRNNNRENSGNAAQRQQQQVVYATVLMIMPGVIAGGSLAITLEGMVPSTAILILALGTLLLASTKTYFKAQKMRHAEQQQQQQDGNQPPMTSFLSPIPILTSPSYSWLNSQNNHHPQSPRRLNVSFQQQQRDTNNPNDEDHEENQQLLDDNKEASALVESALEWGSVLAGDSGGSKQQQLAIETSPSNTGRATPSGEEVAPDSCRSIDNISLLDVNDTSNQEIMEERFFGSIGYLIRAAMTPEENTALIIDESSVAASLAASIDYYLGSGSGTNGQGPTGDALNLSRGSVYRHVGVCGRCVAFCSRHRLEFLIGGFWLLDATTFLLLHTGSLLPKCSTGYFVFLGCPALVAATFVGLGRCHLQGQQRRLAGPIRRGMRTGSANDPLYFSLFPGSPGASSEDNEENLDNPGPVPIIDSGEEYSFSAASVDSHRWVLLLPLAALCAGILDAFRHRPFFRQSHRRSPGGGEQDLSVPFLSHSGGVGSPAGSNNSLFSTPSRDNSSPNNEREGGSQHDNFQSLLVWWLPFVSVLIGLLAALLGIGGGEILGPILLLLLKMDPQESSATTAIMSMMNSGTNLLHYIVADMMMAPGYAFHLGLAGLIGGSGGRMWAISMAQTGRTSIIAMSLCGVLSLATALVAWELFTTPVSWESNPDLC